MGALVAVGLSTLEPTPLGLAAAAIVLLGVSVAVWAARCPHCGRHLGLIVGFRYCTGCGRRT